MLRPLVASCDTSWPVITSLPSPDSVWTATAVASTVTLSCVLTDLQLESTSAAVADVQGDIFLLERFETRRFGAQRVVSDLEVGRNELTLGIAGDLCGTDSYPCWSP